MKNNTEGGDSFSFYFTLIISLVTGVLAITSESLWIDEANSAYKAMQPALASWWQVLVHEKGSEMQMPFHMLYLWSWEKIAGHSEISLRLANLPWLFLANYSFYRVCRSKGVSAIPLLTLASLNPFLWFYLNEARPYLMQYAGSCLTIYGLSEIHDRRIRQKLVSGSSFWLLAVGMLLLAGSSLLGVAWAGTALLALMLISSRSLRQFPLRDAWTPFLFLLIGSLLLGCYYLWTLEHGGGGSRASNISLESTLYILYELFGFTGLGPSRLKLRELGFDFASGYLFALVSLAVIETAVLFAAVRVLFRSTHRTELLAGSIYGALAASVVWVFGVATHFRILGRHLTPLAPLVPIVLTVGMLELWRTRRQVGAFAMCLLWLVSALLLRFAPRHRKDDYRSAAAEALSTIAQGGFVWWAADRAGANYYQVPLDRRAAILLANPLSQDLAELSPPKKVILSKKDLYDANGAIAAFLAREQYREVRKIPAFTVWQR